MPVTLVLWRPRCGDRQLLGLAGGSFQVSHLSECHKQRVIQQGTETSPSGAPQLINSTLTFLVKHEKQHQNALLGFCQESSVFENARSLKPHCAWVN